MDSQKLISWIYDAEPKLAKTSYPYTQYSDETGITTIKLDNHLLFEDEYIDAVRNGIEYLIENNDVNENEDRIENETKYIAYFMNIERKISFRRMVGHCYYFDLYLLCLNDMKLGRWETFQESQFYRNIPKEIRGEIFAYLYYEMITIKFFDIRGPDIIELIEEVEDNRGGADDIDDEIKEYLYNIEHSMEMGEYKIRIANGVKLPPIPSHLEMIAQLEKMNK